MNPIVLQVAKEAFEKIASRIALEINTWEKKNNIVHGIKDKIVKVFKRDFELMEGQIAKLEGEVKISFYDPTKEIGLKVFLKLKSS